jgi:hypothetical protein
VLTCLFRKLKRVLRGYLLIAAGKNKTVSFSSFMKEGAKFLGVLRETPTVPLDCYKPREGKGASATLAEKITPATAVGCYRCTPHSLHRCHQYVKLIQGFGDIV